MTASSAGAVQFEAEIVKETESEDDDETDYWFMEAHFRTASMGSEVALKSSTEMEEGPWVHVALTREGRR